MKLRKSQLQAIIREELSQGGHFAKPDKSHKSELNDMRKTHNPHKDNPHKDDSAILRRIISAMNDDHFDANDTDTLDAIRRILQDAKRL